MKEIGHIETSDGKLGIEHEKQCGGALGTLDGNDLGKLICVKCGWFWKIVPNK